MLLVLSTFVGALIVPPLEGVLPQTTELEHGRVMTLEIASGVIAIAGILIAAWLWLGKRTLVTSIANSAPGRLLGTWWYNAWGFDWLYDKVFVKPFLGVAWLLKSDPLNALMNIPAILSRFRRQRPGGERERLSALVCGFYGHRRCRGAGAADGIALSLRIVGVVG